MIPPNIILKITDFKGQLLQRNRKRYRGNGKNGAGQTDGFVLKLLPYVFGATLLFKIHTFRRGLKFILKGITIIYSNNQSLLS